MMRREDLKELTDERTGPCVSIYMPTHKGSIDTKQNPVMFRKLLREAELKLAAAGLKPAEAQSLLAPAAPLRDDHMFWQYQSGGLAVFLSRRVKRSYLLPLQFTPLAAAGERFCVRQLLPLFAEDGRFSVLALSQKAVRLFQCSRYSVTEFDLGAAPKGIGELLELNAGSKQLQFHAAGARGPAGMAHGGAGDTDESRANALQYLRSVNRAVSAVMGGGGPLVLAGVDYLTRLYEKANTYPRLAEGRIAGSPEALKPEELRDRAWELLRPGFEAEAAAAAERFGQANGTHLASNHLKTILRAAVEGRVGTLLVSATDQRWGFYDDASGVLDLHQKPDPCDTELLELCVTRTLDQGGKVYALPPERMPGKAPAAALLRY